MAGARPDLPAVIRSLPSDHARALRATLEGGDADQVAALVGVPVEAVVPLLRLAATKLDRALARSADDEAPAAEQPFGR